MINLNAYDVNFSTGQLVTAVRKTLQVDSSHIVTEIALFVYLFKN